MPIRNQRAALVLFCLLNSAVAADVYRCNNAPGILIFSQFPCATDGNFDTLVVASTNVISSPPLTSSERITLDRIQRQSDRHKKNASANLRQARRRSNNNRVERIKLCASARDSLKNLRERKRRGYSLATAGSLDAEQTHLKAELAKHC